MGRLRGLMWLAAGLVVALLAGLVGFMTLSRAAARVGGETESIPTQAVVVAARPVPLGTLLAAEDLEVRQFPAEAIPEGAVGRASDAEGRLSSIELSAGEPILAQRLIDPNVVSTDGRAALYLAENEVLMAVPAVDLLSQVNVLEVGDRVDLLVSLDFSTTRDMQDVALPVATEGAAAETSANDEEQTTFTVLQNVGIAGIVYPAGAGAGDGQAPQALLLTLAPQDALVLKYAQDADGMIDLVLRAPDVGKSFETEPVDLDYIINRYRIPYEQGR
jgi:Flp pilus assembly protein CpaB